MRLFHLVRDEDSSGISGTGVIAQGVEFDHGMCAFTWLTPYRKVDIAENIKTIQKIHGHEGNTRVVWIYDTDPINTVPDVVDTSVLEKEQDASDKKEDEDTETEVEDGEQS